ncbi:MAG: DUF7467 domain-containing protein [Planctomycetota bacterium]|jgi:hypothetical protein
MSMFRRAIGALGALAMTLLTSGPVQAADAPAHTLHIRILDEVGQPIVGSMATVRAPDTEDAAQILDDWTHYAQVDGHAVTITAVAPPDEVMVTELTLPPGMKGVVVEISPSRKTYDVRPLGWTTEAGTPLPQPAAARAPAEEEAADGEGPTICMAGQIPEGEPDCFDGYVDEFNGGFNSDPPVFSSIECTNVYCGEFGTFVTNGMPMRDTDWYALDLTVTSEVTWSAMATVGHAITTLNEQGFVEGEFEISSGGEEISVTNILDPGTWYFFIAPSAFAGVECGSPYVAELTCTPVADPLMVTADDAVLCPGGTASTCAIASGGTQPYTYAWTGPGGFTSSNQCIDVSVAGTYTVIVTDDANMTASDDAIISLSDLAVTVADATVCPEQTHQFCAVVTGGTLPYAYSWTGPGGFTATTECINVNVPGLYTVTVTDLDNEGCTVSDSGTLSVSFPDVTVNDATVCEGQTHQFCPQITGGTPPFTYAWTGPGGFTATTECITVGVAGLYSLTVTDELGCTGGDNATLTIGALDVTVDDATICQGEMHQFCPTVIGGTAPFVYAWTGPGGFTATTECITVDVPGLYTVTVTDQDGEGCTGMDSATLTVTTITATLDDATICQGEMHEFCVNVTGGTPPYTYFWSTTESTECITTGTAGLYTVTVTDMNGCSAGAQATLTVTDIMVTVDDATICSGAEHQFCPTVVGGTPPLTYAWTGPGGFTSMDECIVVSTAGDYMLTVTDANDCVGTATATLSVTTVSVVVDDASICEGGQHQFCPVVTGGTPPYTYAWTGPGGFTATTECITVSTPGLYQLTVTDNLDCLGSDSATLSVGSLTVTVDDASICEGAEHQFCPTVTGGTPPFVYAWTGPGGFTADTECITVGVPGTYSLTVTDQDGEGCSGSDDATLTQTEVSVTVADATICAGAEHEFCPTITGGTAPFTYAWTGPGGFTADTECITVSVAGLYALTVTDVNGCTASTDATLTVTAITVTVDDATICAGADHEFCPTVTGGTAPLTYAWTGPGGFTADTECITVNVAGDYTLTVTDANDCSAMTTATLTVTTISASVDDATICAGAEHEFCVTVTGGTPPYTYFWSTTESTECITTGTAGLYTVTVTDANGCSAGAEATLTVTEITATVADATICEGAEHEFCPTVTGGTPPLTYAWTGPGGFTADTECITVGVAGAYELTVTDANECAATASATLTVTEITASVDDATICEGAEHEFCPMVVGGTPPLTYAWAGPGGFMADTECITVGVAGDYTLAVTDANGCVAGSTATLTVIEIEASVNDAQICDGDAAAELCATVTGGTPPYTYLWSTMETTECIAVDQAGEYCVTVTDASGCTTVACGMLVVNEPPSVALPPAPTPVCGSEDNVLTATIAGGAQPYQILWMVMGDPGWTITGGQGTDTITYTAGASGTSAMFGVMVTDANECSADASVTISCQAECVVDVECSVEVVEDDGRSGSASGSVGSSGSGDPSSGSGSSGSSADNSSAASGGSAGGGGPTPGRRLRVEWEVTATCEPVETTAVIDIGCEQIAVENGQIVDVVCLCQPESGDGSGSSGSGSASGVSSGSHGGGDGGSSSSGASGASSGGSGNDPCACLFGSGSSGSAGDCGCDSGAASSASGSSHSSNGASGPDSSHSGPGSGSIGSSGSSGSSGSASEGHGPCCVAIPGEGEQPWLFASTTVVLIVTVTDAEGNVAQCEVDLCTVEDPPPTAQLCPGGGLMPAILSLEYTGASCEATSHGQDSGMVICDQPAATLPDTVYIRSTNAPFGTPGALVWFEGWVSVGESFELTAAAAGQNRLLGTTYVHVLAGPGEALLQTTQFHTSCSQPLAMGDQYGADRLMALVANGMPAEDVNGDGTVDFSDVMQVYGAWGPCPDCYEDVDQDGIVDMHDVLAVMSSM